LKNSPDLEEDLEEKVREDYEADGGNVNSVLPGLVAG
jgi:hypothetical protein